MQRFAVEVAGERIERRHDVGDRAIAVVGRVRGRRLLGLGPDAGVGGLDHLLAVVHADQVVLEDVVVEHVLRGLAEVDDPLGDGRRLHAEGHVLGVGGAGGVVVAADAADPAGDEVRVAGILALHEDAVPPENGRGAVTLGHFLVLEVDLGEDPETPHDPGDRIPVHLHQLPRLALRPGPWGGYGRGHRRCSFCLVRRPWGDSRWSARPADGATSAPC